MGKKKKERNLILTDGSGGPALQRVETSSGHGMKLVHELLLHSVIVAGLHGFLCATHNVTATTACIHIYPF